MAKRTVSKSKTRKAQKPAASKSKAKSKAQKPKARAAAKKTTANAKPAAASASKKAARKRAAKLKAIEAARVAEQTAAATVNYAPAPFEPVAEHDPSKAPGKQHRHPPQSLVGVKHSEAYIAKARTPFNRRMNIGR